MVIGSLRPEYCPFCRRTHYIGDARGPGQCPTEEELLRDELLDMVRSKDKKPPNIK